MTPRELLDQTMDEEVFARTLMFVLRNDPDNLPDVPWLVNEMHHATATTAVAIACALGARHDGSEEIGLREFARHHADPDVRRAVLAELKARGLEAGSVSIVDSPSGSLSITDDGPRGALSKLDQ